MQVLASLGSEIVAKMVNVPTANDRAYLWLREGKGIPEKTPGDITACRREYLRTALRSEERLYRLGSPLEFYPQCELRAIEGAVMVY
ncbi:hypothetical protein AVEN_214988-1 [Araneus ventricosus]|uniref:Uncharacterized protein n=1 Tax=Araneus ventricosus TaxID=182803 RepID=A0A4Y2N5W5_ARAVE|nr:hypothetical protein AVEN_252072-1 [Araneus ventricosus]GBN34014.1 hypothetical protein AVEN_154743-1 [Araneus ventricosus]GBN59035.1 hypothetical protein AVEN_239700-1 [Araneus ventricosus]GBN59051.1 hypothetical protein AVEN_214988-1 [Araneus ventricosus]